MQKGLLALQGGGVANVLVQLIRVVEITHKQHKLNDLVDASKTN